MIERLFILVVGGDVKERNRLQALLDIEGHSLLTANSGASAIELARTNHFDIIFVDDCLEDFDAIKLLNALKAISTSCKGIILMSDIFNSKEHMTLEDLNKASEFEAKAIEAGAKKVIKKPFSVATIMDILETISKIMGFLVSIGDQAAHFIGWTKGGK
ncbi:hypothetical protein AGMMS49995_10390 [Endomicrobiia bacterium]|nr:hypothetical protein AGMMS49995_10390 [Endomicrobiia bacterium]